MHWSHPSLPLSVPPPRTDLPDGTIFDGQHAKGKKPLAFKIGAKQVIPGLEEALASMKPGGERQILVGRLVPVCAHRHPSIHPSP